MSLTQPLMKTKEVCQELKQPYYTLMAMIRCGYIERPRKDVSGDYLWSPTDIAAVRNVLAAR